MHDGSGRQYGSFLTAPNGRAAFRFTSFGDQATPQTGNRLALGNAGGFDEFTLRRPRGGLPDSNRLDPQSAVLRRGCMLAAVCAHRLALATERLCLVPFTAGALDALIDKDRARLEAITETCFPEPLEAPPLVEDALPSLRDDLLSAEAEPGWGLWLVSILATSEAIGCVGLARPDEQRRVLLGYAIYPRFAGLGYATEATRALISWSLDQVGVAAVRATIPQWHTPSLRVAQKAGMRQTGTARDDEVGDVLVFEVRRG